MIQDFKEAVTWYCKAAELGYAKAMVNLGIMYAGGFGVIEDDVEAYALPVVCDASQLAPTIPRSATSTMPSKYASPGAAAIIIRPMWPA